MPPIRPDFLPPHPPANITSSIINFTRSTPPIPRYEGHFAAVIDNFMTPDECAELLSLAEQSSMSSSPSPSNEPNWERAMVNIGNGQQKMIVDQRKCGRIIVDSPEIAGRLLARLHPFFQQWDMELLQGKGRSLVTGFSRKPMVYRLSRLNERLRFLKYVGGEYFRPHCDGSYHTPDGRERSLYTVHLYLNGDGEEGQDVDEVLRLQDMDDRGQPVVLPPQHQNPSDREKLLGGATSFLSWSTSAENTVRVWPKTGRVLVFQQNGLLHSGDAVFRGTKYTVRTDVMYSMEVAEEQ